MKVFIPTPLRCRCGDESELHVKAASVRGLLEELARSYPGLYGCICDETGAVRRHINLFVDRNHIRDLRGLETPLLENDTLFIMTAVSGG